MPVGCIKASTYPVIVSLSYLRVLASGRTSIPLLRRLKTRPRVLPQGFGKWAYIYLFLCRDSNRQPSGGKEAAEQNRRFTVGFSMVLVRFAVGFLIILPPKPIQTPREFDDFFETCLAKILSRGGFSFEANAHFGCCTTLRRRQVGVDLFLYYVV